MRTSRAGRHLFTSSDEDSEEDELEGRRARPHNPWLAPVHVSVVEVATEFLNAVRVRPCFF